MDTSETFIKMCDCPEIQGVIEKSETLWLDPHNYWVNASDVINWRPLSSEDFSRGLIWLPRQDQLQEIYNDGNFGLQTLCCFIYDFVTSEYGSRFTIISGSMNQLWLAFVMKELFQKIWDGENWIKGVNK